MRERDVLTKLKSQAESATQKQADLVRITENNKKTLEQEIAGYRSEASKQAKAIFGLSRSGRSLPMRRAPRWRSSSRRSRR